MKIWLFLKILTTAPLNLKIPSIEMVILAERRHIYVWVAQVVELSC